MIIKNTLILCLFILFIPCINGQNKTFSNEAIDYSKEILGCWELVNINYKIKSNYPSIDSLVLKNLQENKEDLLKEKENLTLFFSDLVSLFDKDSTPISSPSTYYLKSDSIYMQGTVFQNDDKAEIRISDDTLYLGLDTPDEFRRVLHNLKWFYRINIPEHEDIKLERMVWYGIFIRPKDCDRYR